MRLLMLAALAASSVVLSLPAAAAPASPVAGLSSPSEMLTDVRMSRHHMRHHSMSRMHRGYPGASFVRKRTRGAPAGSNMGNGATGSVAAPSGQGH
ncbi:hypothetical protein ACRAWG_21915 [Methylobacterium sp. P31]